MSDTQNAQHVGPGVYPYLTIREGRGKEAAEFYAKAFAATEVMRMLGEDSGLIMHCHLHLNGSSVMLSDDFVSFTGGVAAPSAVTIHLEVDDADKWFNRAVEAGCEAAMPLENTFWGARYGQVKDPFGHRWAISGRP